MLFFFHFFFAFSLKPLFLFDGFDRSPLYGTFNPDEALPETKNACPKDLNHFQFFPPLSKDFYTQYPECQAYFMTAYYDETTKTVDNLPGFKVVSDDFGNYTQLSSYATFVDFAIQQGYTPYKDLFGVGYNFMMHPFGNKDTLEEIKSNAEKVKQDIGEKLIFVANNEGCHFVNQFLTSYVDSDWVNNYVESVIYIAPTFAGSGTFHKLIEGQYGLFLATSAMKKAIYKMPGQLILLPNHLVYGDTTIIKHYPEYGQIAKASDIKNFLANYLHIITDDNSKIYDEIEHFLKQPIAEPPVKSFIMYNTAINTPSSYKIQRYTEQLQAVLGRGDGVISPESAEFACSNWTQVTCLDWGLNKRSYSHDQMINDNTSLTEIFNFISNSSDETEKKSSSSWPIILGAIIICGIQVAIVIVALIFIIPKQYPRVSDQELTTVDGNSFPGASEV